MLLLKVSVCSDIINVYRNLGYSYLFSFVPWNKGNLDSSYLFSFVPWYFQTTFVVIIITFQCLKERGKKLFSSVEDPYITFIYLVIV